MMIASKMWPLECLQGLPLIWPSDLVFYHKWPSFQLDLEIIKTNILSKIHDDCFKKVVARVLMKFSTDLARWPSFLPHVTQYRTGPWNHQDKHFEQDSWWLLQKVTTRVLTRFSADLAWWPSFWPQMTQFWTWPWTYQENYFEQD